MLIETISVWRKDASRTGVGGRCCQRTGARGGPLGARTRGGPDPLCGRRQRRRPHRRPVLRRHERPADPGDCPEHAVVAPGPARLLTGRARHLCAPGTLDRPRPGRCSVRRPQAAIRGSRHRPGTRTAGAAMPGTRGACSAGQLLGARHRHPGAPGRAAPVRRRRVGQSAHRRRPRPGRRLRNRRQPLRSALPTPA